MHCEIRNKNRNFYLDFFFLKDMTFQNSLVSHEGEAINLSGRIFTTRIELLFLLNNPQHGMIELRFDTLTSSVSVIL